MSIDNRLLTENDSEGLRLMKMSYEGILASVPNYVGDLDFAIAKWIVKKDPALVAWLVSQAGAPRAIPITMRQSAAHWAINSLCAQSALFREHAISAGWEEAIV